VETSPTKTVYAVIFRHMHATCRARLVLLEVIVITIYDEEDRLLSPHCARFSNHLSLNSS
jgi:hypothetical protein